jgi:hypothetical protein
MKGGRRKREERDDKERRGPPNRRVQTEASVPPRCRKTEEGPANVGDDITGHVMSSISLPYLPAFYLDFPHLSHQTYPIYGPKRLYITMQT